MVKPRFCTSVGMLGLFGLRIFEATSAGMTDLGEEHGHRVLRVCGNVTKVVLIPLPPRSGGPSIARLAAGQAGRSCCSVAGATTCITELRTLLGDAAALGGQGGLRGVGVVEADNQAPSRAMSAMVGPGSRAKSSPTA